MIKRLLRPKSLRTEILYTCLGGLALAVLLCLLMVNASRLYIDRVYMGAPAVEQRQGRVFESFSSFVSANDINSRDIAAISHWSAGHRWVNLTIWDVGANHFNYSGGSTHTQDRLFAPHIASPDKLYLIRFADGLYQVSISDSSQKHFFNMAKSLSALLGCMAFFFIILRYTGSLSLRIIRLSKEAAIVGGGDIEHPILAEGNDEIKSLAMLMDEMRLSLIEKMRNEERGWAANAELITAISHDIRTPMTSLLGYLELLGEGDFEDKQQSRQFCQSAHGKAMELKELTDELFRYFLLYGKDELDIHLEPYDGSFLFEQLAAEAELDLSDAGFKVQRIGKSGECSVMAEPLYLKRVVDNMVSNIKKYADPARPVLLILEQDEKELRLCLSNYIARSMDRAESTKIGLRSCRKIMSAMNGSFTTVSDPDHFAAELAIAVEADEK